MSTTSITLLSIFIWYALNFIVALIMFERKPKQTYEKKMNKVIFWMAISGFLLLFVVILKAFDMVEKIRYHFIKRKEQIQITYKEDVE